jgi:hypothetical protein
MSLHHGPKDQTTEEIRQLIKQSVPEADETDRAAASLCSLSFQSNRYPERHVWLDTGEMILQIDLEDWQNGKEWDNAIARVTVESVKEAIALTQAWLSGSRLEEYSNLNQVYGLIDKVVPVPS